MNPFPPLPALAHLGDLRELKPRILVDTREQDPLLFSRLECCVEGLTTGDYSIDGLEHLFAVERKSIADLVSCCAGSNRDRFERELHRLRGYRFKRLLIVGTEADILAGNYRSQIEPKAVLHTLYALEARYDIPYVFQPTPTDAAAWLEVKAWWFTREHIEDTNSILRAGKKPAY